MQDGVQLALIVKVASFYPQFYNFVSSCKKLGDKKEDVNAGHLLIRIIRDV